MFEHNGTYYITASDPPCSYCAGGTGYFMATEPLGTWHDADGVPGQDTTLSIDSCGGQPRSVTELPTQSGPPVYLNQVDLWRTSPNQQPGNNGPPGYQPLQGGDENQAIAGRYWVPLRFRANGTIEPYPCQQRVRVPLARGHKPATPAAPVYQVDCRAASGITMQASLPHVHPTTPQLTVQLPRRRAIG